MDNFLVGAMIFVVVALVVAMVLRAQRRGRPQPLDGLTDDVYQEIPNADRGSRGFREGQPRQ